MTRKIVERLCVAKSVSQLDFRPSFVIGDVAVCSVAVTLVPGSLGGSTETLFLVGLLVEAMPMQLVFGRLNRLGSLPFSATSGR